jgi:hypothetical protein
LKTFSSRSLKAVASTFLATGLFAVALAVPNPITGTPEARAAANPNDPPLFANQRYIREDGDFVYLVHSNGVYYQNNSDNEFYSNLSATAPDPARFTVMVGTTPNPVTSVVVIKNYVLKLSVTNRIAKDAVVTVAYSAAGVTSKIQTITGVAAADFGIPVPLEVGNASTYVPQTVPNAPGVSTVLPGEESATITVKPPTSGPAPTSYVVTSSPDGKTCTVDGPSGSCTISGLTAGVAYTFTTVAKTASGSSAASTASASTTVLAKTTTTVPASTGTTTATIPAGYTPSWDREPQTDSETDANTVGFFPAVSPGVIIITDEMGFTLDKKNGIKPKIRMKNYAGKIKMSISASYKVGAKTVKYKCAYAPFGTAKKIKTSKWRWYTPKKACVLPAPLVAAVRANTATLSASGKWKRQWLTTSKKARPDKTKIKARTLKYTMKAKPAAVK